MWFTFLNRNHLQEIRIKLCVFGKSDVVFKVTRMYWLFGTELKLHYLFLLDVIILLNVIDVANSYYFWY